MPYRNYNNAPIVEEFDELEAGVFLTSGAHTQPLAVDLEKDTSRHTVGPVNGGFDSTDGRQPNIRVTTYVERNQITIFVRTFLGGDKQNITIRLPPTAHVSDLKDKITAKIQPRVHQNDYYLEYEGSTLNGAYKLSHYRIGNNSHVTMRQRLRGG